MLICYAPFMIEIKSALVALLLDLVVEVIRALRRKNAGDREVIK